MVTGIVVTRGGTAIVPASNLTPSVLDQHKTLLIQLDSMNLLMQQKEVNTYLTLYADDIDENETEETAAASNKKKIFDAIYGDDDSAYEVPEKVEEQEMAEGSKQNEYIMDKEDIRSLISHDDNVMEELIETLDAIGSKMILDVRRTKSSDEEEEEVPTTLDSRSFLKKVLNLRRMYDVSYIFNRLQCMDERELQAFANSDDDETLEIFQSIIEERFSDDDEEDSEYDEDM